MQGYQELQIWQRSRQLVSVIYSLAKQFPPNEQYGLVSQIQRCVISVPSNIAEGWSRNSTKEFVNFLYTARGSLAELETQLLLATDLGYIQTSDLTPVLEEIVQINKMLIAMINTLKQKTLDANR